MPGEIIAVSIGYCFYDFTQINDNVLTRFHDHMHCKSKNVNVNALIEKPFWVSLLL